MQIVIDIDEDYYEIIKHNVKVFDNDFKPYVLIANGTPLPKGHGRLIDADDAKREWQNVLDCEVEHPRYQCTIRDVLEDAPTIIEADKAESEE
jgi:hypothetical protein